jgi:hypothetical protein
MRRSLVIAHEEGVVALICAIIASTIWAWNYWHAVELLKGSCYVLSFDSRSVRRSLTPSFSAVVLILRAESGVSHDLFTSTRNSLIEV